MINIIDEDIEVLLNIDLSKLRNKSILITGASGLIGLYFLSLIKSKQEDLNIKIYTWTKNSIDDIFEPLFNNCITIVSDITDYYSYDKLPNFDFIIHAAGYGQPGKFMDDKIKTIEINTLSTKLLLEKLYEDGTFVFISTSEIYSGIDSLELTEEMIGSTSTIHPRACYIEGKRTGETICNIYREKGKDIKIVRLSLAYGPGTKRNDARVLNSLIEKSIKHESITLLDKGRAIRTYCYITDVIEMILNIMFNGKDFIYNVGGVSKLSVIDLAHKIGIISGKKVIIPDIDEELLGSPKTVNISINRYLNEFNKKKFVDSDEGLKKTIEWQKKLYIIK
jgi:nucleoside-diphosphate-sugar epimerase